MVEANGKLDHETMRKVTFQIPPWYYVRLALITLESDQFPMFLYYQHLCHDLGWLLCWGNQPLTQETNLPTSETFVTTMHIVMITLLVHRTDRVINWRLLVTFEKKCLVINCESYFFEVVTETHVWIGIVCSVWQLFPTRPQGPLSDSFQNCYKHPCLCCIIVPTHFWEQHHCPAEH